MRRLAQLDSAAALTGLPLIAEVDGEAVAAYSPEEGRAIANPFRHTAAAVELLMARGQRLGGGVVAPVVVANGGLGISRKRPMPF